RIKRTRFGYYQLAAFRTPEFPVDPPAEMIGGYVPTNDATGFFAVGTLSHAVLVQLEWSLSYILELGVQRIQDFRQPLITRLKTELPRMGYPLLTPPESTSAI